MPTPIDIAWVLLAGGLVFLMQAGFMCLESGLVRQKNATNVAIKNLIDFCIAALLFWLFGFALMFGESWNGWIGTSHFALGNGSLWLISFFFFQVMFCGTATTIVSGAVAERMRFSGYCLTSIIISGFIYPVVGHWAWNGADNGQTNGWLGQLGFIDFAGSTMVHSVGGWMSLAAVLVLGPRVGRFGPHGKAIEASSLPMVTLGVFLLWFGWFGFNGGSTLRLNESVAHIIVNTTLAAAAGGIAAMILTWTIRGKPIVDEIMNGVIAGLVAITANCHLVSFDVGVVIGVIGGIISVYGSRLLQKLEIDDAVGAVPVHLFCGIWGTLAVALAPEGSWGNGHTRWEQLLVQLQGVAVVGLYCFAVGYGMMQLLSRFMKLRVTEHEERIGLNVVEHDAGTTMLDLLNQMSRQARTGDFTKPVEVEPETDAANIAAFYNSVLTGFNQQTGRNQMALQKLSQLANYDTLTGLANRRLFFEALKRALLLAKRNQQSGGILYCDIDGFKWVNDNLGHEAGDRVLKELARRLADCSRESDVLARIGGDEFCLLMENTANPDAFVTVAEKILAALSAPIGLDKQSLQLGVSIGIAGYDVDHDETPSTLMHKADSAMYTAKLSGKGNFRFYIDGNEEFTPDFR